MVDGGGWAREIRVNWLRAALGLVIGLVAMFVSAPEQRGEQALATTAS